MLQTSFWFPDFHTPELFTQNLEWAIEAGLENIDMDLSESPTRDLYRTDELEKRVTAARDAFQKYHLDVYMGHAPYNPRHCDSEISRRNIEDIRYSITLAGRLGIHNLVVHPIFAQMNDPLFGHNDTLLRMNVDFYAEMVELGKQNGVTICTENMFICDSAHHVVPTFTSTTEDLNLIMDSVPDLKVCLDNGHFWLLGIDMVQAVYDFGDRLRVLHLHSNDGLVDSHVGPFELNRLPWEQFCKALKDIGFKGTMNLESSSTFDRAPRAMYSASFRYLQASSAYLVKMMNDAK